MVKLAVSRRVGSYAGVVVVTMLSFLITGALWGALRPGYQATVIEDSRVELGTEANVEFTAFFWFVLASAVIGGAVALVTYLRSPRTRGVAMLLWIVVLVLVGAQGFIFVGEWVTNLVHGVDSPESLNVGDTVTYVPYFSAGLAGNVVGGFWAALIYWCLMVSDPTMHAPEAADGGSVQETQESAVAAAQGGKS